MRIKQTVKRIIFLTSFVFAFFVALAPVSVSAEGAENTNNGVSISETSQSEGCDSSTENCCGGIKTSIVTCGQQGGKDADIKDTGVWGILLLGINILTAGVGVVAVAGIVWASILYTSSRGEADKVKKAMTIISDIVIGIVAYALMYAALNFLVPGGLFN